VKNNPLIPKMPRVSKRPRMPKTPSVPMPPAGGTSVPAGLGDPGPGGPMTPNPISQGKIQIGGFNPKKGGMF
jgi:hypothetical protein